MTITDLSPREQEAIDWASTTYGWPGANSNEGFVLQTQFAVEQYAKQMDQAAFNQLYTDFQALPPASQDAIKAEVEAAKAAAGT